MSYFLSDNTVNIIYFGKKLCENFTKKENKPCTNFAYYLYNGKYCCGVHSKKDNRTELPKNPNRKEIIQQKIKTHHETCQKIAKENKKKNKKGDVICCKMYMMKAVKL